MSRGRSRTRIGRYLATPMTLTVALFMIPVAALAAEEVTSVTASAYGVHANVETTTTVADACLAAEEHNDEFSALASNNSGTGLGALRIGGSASVGDGGTVPVVLNILILLVAAALGAVGGYAIHKFGLFDRMARVKGAGL